MFEDQLGNKIELKMAPKRIISLVPSQTELLYSLGLEEEVVGITKFCVHPHSWLKKKTIIGGPKTLHLNKIAELKPDLIIGNKEENTKEQIEKAQAIAPVWLSDIYNLADSLEMIERVADITSKAEEGKRIVQQIKDNFSTLKPLKKQPLVLYLIWKKPYIAVASKTFINHILTVCLGAKNALENQERYPELNMENLPEVDYVFLSTEPYPFKEKHFPEIKALFPKAKVLLVDGEYFSWYGSRLIETAKYLEELKNSM